MLLVVAALLAVTTLSVTVLYLRCGPRDELARWSKAKATVGGLSPAAATTVQPAATWCRPVPAAAVPAAAGPAAFVPQPREGEPHDRAPRAAASAALAETR
jgi:hypothetical protein